MELKQLNKYMPGPLVEKRVRQAAVDRVHRDMILHGKTETDFSDEDLEYLLADAERELWSSIKGNSLKVVLVLLGISWL